MVSFEQLSKADSGRWVGQATSWATLSNALESQAQQLTARYQPLHTAWVGRDADAAAAHVEVLRKELLGHADRFSVAASTLRRHADPAGRAVGRGRSRSGRGRRDRD